MFAIGELINIMQRGGASLDRVNETLSVKPDVDDIAEPVHVDAPDAIQFSHVTFQYPASTMINLDNIHLLIRRGETLGVVGRTGSGKTTLLKQLLHEYPLGSGELTISGVPIQHISLRQ